MNKFALKNSAYVTIGDRNSTYFEVSIKYPTVDMLELILLLTKKKKTNEFIKNLKCNISRLHD